MYQKTIYLFILLCSVSIAFGCSPKRLPAQRFGDKIQLKSSASNPQVAQLEAKIRKLHDELFIDTLHPDDPDNKKHYKESPSMTEINEILIRNSEPSKNASEYTKYKKLITLDESSIIEQFLGPISKATGKCQIEDGKSIYSFIYGECHNGKVHGLAYLEAGDGGKLWGKFDQGHLKKGYVKWPENEYIGELKYREDGGYFMHGFGAWKYKSNNFFVGDFINGNFHGHIVQYRNNYVVFSGRYVKNVTNGFGIRVRLEGFDFYAAGNKYYGWDYTTLFYSYAPGLYSHKNNLVLSRFITQYPNTRIDIGNFTEGMMRSGLNGRIRLQGQFFIGNYKNDSCLGSFEGYQNDVEYYDFYDSDSSRFIGYCDESGLRVLEEYAIPTKRKPVDFKEALSFRSYYGSSDTPDIYEDYNLSTGELVKRTTKSSSSGINLGQAIALVGGAAVLSQYDLSAIQTATIGTAFATDVMTEGKYNATATMGNEIAKLNQEQRQMDQQNQVLINQIQVERDSDERKRQQQYEAKLASAEANCVSQNGEWDAANRRCVRNNGNSTSSSRNNSSSHNNQTPYNSWAKQCQDANGIWDAANNKCSFGQKSSNTQVAANYTQSVAVPMKNNDGSYSGLSGNSVGGASGDNYKPVPDYNQQAMRNMRSDLNEVAESFCGLDGHKNQCKCACESVVVDDKHHSRKDAIESCQAGCETTEMTLLAGIGRPGAPVQCQHGDKVIRERCANTKHINEPFIGYCVDGYEKYKGLAGCID